MSVCLFGTLSTLTLHMHSGMVGEARWQPEGAATAGRTTALAHPPHLGHFCKGSEYAPGVLYRGSPVAALKLPLTACCCELVGLLGGGGGVLLYDF